MSDATAIRDTTTYVLPPPPRPALAVLGTDGCFAVRRIWCIARNYAEHAREMGHDPGREPPFFFSKPADALVAGGGRVAYPPMSTDVQHEIELVAAIGRPGRDIVADQAPGHVFGYAVGLDLTRRDLQREAKKLGRPWEAAKAFDASAPCSALIDARGGPHATAGRIWLEVNGALRQQGDLADMIWSVAECIAHLSRYVALAAGDLLFCGTPAGVGTVTVGDRLRGGIAGVGEIEVELVG